MPFSSSLLTSISVMEAGPTPSGQWYRTCVIVGSDRRDSDGSLAIFVKQQYVESLWEARGIFLESQITFKKNFCWSIIVLQHRVSFCCTMKWVSSMYTCILFLLDIPPSIPPLSVLTDPWAELPVLYSSFPLDIYFTHGTWWEIFYVIFSVWWSKKTHMHTSWGIWKTSELTTATWFQSSIAFVLEPSGMFHQWEGGKVEFTCTLVKARELQCILKKWWLLRIVIEVL